MRVFLFRHPFITNPTIFWTRLHSKSWNMFNILVIFLSGKRYRHRLSTHMLIFVVNIRPAQTLSDSTVYSAPPHLTNHGIYYITRCGIWLLTIFHIPYFNFQLELRKVTPPKLYLSFFCSVYINDWNIVACAVKQPAISLTHFMGQNRSCSDEIERNWEIGCLTSHATIF